MANDNNRNDELQDYLDLLKEYSEKAVEKNQPEEQKQLDTDNLADVVDADFFDDYKVENNEEEIQENDVFISHDDINSVSDPQKVLEINEKTEVKADIISDDATGGDTMPYTIVSESDGDTMPYEVISDSSDSFEEEENIQEEKPAKKKGFVAWFKGLSKKKKIILSIIAVFLAFVMAVIAFAGIFVLKKISLIGDNSAAVQQQGEEAPTGEEEIPEEEIADIEIDIGSAGFRQALIDWSTTGNDRHMKSKEVINVLLIGADSRSGRNEGNTDVMMLLSVNKKTKKLKMVSFLRDSYLYIEGKNNSYCTKLNAAFSMGGPECLIKTIENNYKIEIDNYVMVNFESFEDIIDAMGGVTVDVQGYEANYIQSFFGVSMPKGEDVTLNGKQALAFCRVRGCDADGDVSRTRRQRQVIDSMVTRVIDSSISEINEYIDILLPYVETGYSETQIISLGLKAITGGWALYDRTQISVPDEEDRIPGDANMWIWVIDYQKAARKLQKELYGESNIVLSDDRVSIIDSYR